ncbi:hypothetical protein CQZ94_16530 [Bacillus sp. MYb209]|uniref:hypothetical protein n=1 Tax=Bacillus sp. MYb209 TaxID=1848605 RepID=UPI000CFCB423|nr:hypothetical protein [Bacillus sp. MYb209]PQZ54918.1 hypothetical protein CQZ94_16530 [Bacillus sp. MYb209]
MKGLNAAFVENNYTFIRDTSKAIEFENSQSKEVVYLLHNVEISIVLNPKTVENNDSLMNRSSGKYHNTALRQFPKRKNKGKSLIHYGYMFKFQPGNELSTFLTDLNGR